MTSEMIQVTKRDGRLESLDIEKIHRVVSWAAEGLDVSPSEVELKAQIQLYNGIHTEAIHATLIKSAADLISLENPDYQYMAARLAVFNIRKIAYGEYTPPRLYTHIQSMIEKGIYDKEIQSSMFKALGFTEEQAQEQFGFLLDAFEYGVPPHGGCALGLDRFVMLLAGRDNLRDTIAFPKTANAADPMTQAPSPVDLEQLLELNISLLRK